ncbi:MAG: 30S ribosomal protein S6 [Candidatus Saccharimonadia bacterium]
MRPYELVVLLHPDLEIDADAPISKLEKLAENAGGKIVKRDNWGKKRLAYRFKNQDFAVYVYFEIQMDPAKVPGFERNLLLSEEVLRHLLVSKEISKNLTENQKPSKSVTKSNDEVDMDKEESDGEEL